MSFNVKKFPSDFDIFSWLTVDEAIVYPVFRERLAGECFRLRYLVLMMREYQVKSSAVDIKRLDHRLPASDITEHSMCQPGLPFPHGESQLGSSGFADFQRAKSSGALFPLVHSDARAFFQVIKLPFRKLPVILELGDFKVNIPINNISKAVFNKLFDRF